MVTVNTCPVCGNNNFVPHLICKDYTVTKEIFQLTRCLVCNLIITSPRPETEKIGSYYKSESYISHTNKAKGLIDRIYILARHYTLNWKLKLINRHSPIGTILDYGCGTGEFLKSCKNAGWKIEGVEPSSEARSKAEKLIEKALDSFHNDSSELEYDAITLWHVLEHIPDLNYVLHSLCTKLKESGTIFIAVPNYRAYDADHYKEHWAGYDVPRHLWHFSEQSMKVLLKKNSLILKEIVPMKLDSLYVSLLSEKYKNDDKNKFYSFFNAILSGVKSNLRGRKTGDYSSLIYIAAK